KQKHDFAFSGLIGCGHCGCSLVGELKKGKYVYYHCTGNKGKCPEPYVREEILETEFTAALKRLKFDADVLGWVKQALRQSHADGRVAAGCRDRGSVGAEGAGRQEGQGRGAQRRGDRVCRAAASSAPAWFIGRGIRTPRH